ncbi:pro-sigmaK processing inhibitor BofA family protein [Lachnospiraceae bacterium MD1]|jgi:inhibitor of the pro-sigma K processing machinery|uniref:Pro-sigmaK processing inhibitor BofA family protein n=1 Tax=Variimorphobacter saccharofermentans TaxID=2755051 RepID=A0A839K6J6_9FIRM|nr:pro-sigmaK processing inhibitor BofA family protein [Variimorphobacter saccharofermentans]MBB2184699.1 pro-sigmaK processing inhibitor BofA family protein [Variimorphobacter saccharofermentans]
MENIIFITVIVVCLIFILACVIKQRPDLIVNFALRACLGTLAIYLLNMVLKSRGFTISVGINAATVATNGLLGLPGFLLLFGLAVYYFFTA